MNKIINIGVFGGFRGADILDYCDRVKNVRLVAVCDFNQDVLTKVQERCKEKGLKVNLYTKFDEFIEDELDAVILANYANQHAPYAIKCLQKGKHVLSEVLPAANLQEAVHLCETVEQTNKIYYYGENYCFFDVSREMKRLCDKGLLGTIEYAEGEYIHNCEPIWPSLTNGDRHHWRNKKNAFFYCTHSIGPIIHATKLRPISVVGFEPPYNEKMRRMGAFSAPFAVEMITLENGAIMKSVHGELQKNSIWYALYGSLGRIESSRTCTNSEEQYVYTSLDVIPEEPCDEEDKYVPVGKYQDFKGIGIHEQADFYLFNDFIDTICGKKVDYINVYEAMDMFLPGVFAYKSVLAGGVPQSIPNFRLKEDRDKYRNDNSCVEVELAFENVLPSYSKGNPIIPDSVYEKMKNKIKGK